MRPVASDMDALLVGSRGLALEPLPEEQVRRSATGILRRACLLEYGLVTARTEYPGRSLPWRTAPVAF